VKVTNLNGFEKKYLLNARKYAIDWEKDGASKLERRFKELIRPYWKNQIVLFQARIPGSLLRLDFLNLNKKILVEIDGPQHDEFNKFFHNNSRNEYMRHIQRDFKKEDWCKKNDITVIRLDSSDLENFSPSYVLDKYGISIV